MRKFVVVSLFIFAMTVIVGCKPEVVQPNVKGGEKSVKDATVAKKISDAGSAKKEVFSPIVINSDMSRADLIKVIRDLSGRLKTVEENMVCFHKNCCRSCSCGI